MNALRIAACHASPIFLSARDTTNKTISLIKRAAQNNANLVVFPETFIPAFPIWSALRSPAENHDLFKRMTEESLLVDGEHVSAVCSAAKQHDIMVSIGISEKTSSSVATLYNSNLIISAKGDLLVHHRKLVPTFFEKLTWAPGDGFGLRVVETQFGKIGNLICGENTNPLARYTLMAQGEQVHISTWPSIWPTRLAPGTSADGEKTGEQPSVPRKAGYDNVAANRTRAAAHCFEAKCFGVLCSGFFNPNDVDALTAGAESPQVVKTALQHSQQGATMYIDPTGTPLTGFVVDETTNEKETREFLQHKEGIIYADLNLQDCIEGKQYHDVAGGYQRLDVFDLKVDRSRRKPVTMVGEEGKVNIYS